MEASFPYGAMLGLRAAASLSRRTGQMETNNVSRPGRREDASGEAEGRDWTEWWREHLRPEMTTCFLGY